MPSNSSDVEVRKLANRTALKNAIERLLLTFIAICMVVVLITLFFQTQTLNQEVKEQHKILTQVRTITQQIQAGSNLRGHQVAEINRHLDCIVMFFSQPDRSNTAIADIKTCTLTTHSSDESTRQQPHITTQPTTQKSSNSNAKPIQPSKRGAATSPKQPGTMQRILNFFRRLVP